MTEKFKYRIKGDTTTNYCWAHTIPTGELKERKVGDTTVKIPLFKTVYYADEQMTQELDIDTIDVIPCEPYELFGIECGKGWHNLLKPILDFIEKYNIDKEENDKIQICQIKEKFGGLRVYTQPCPDELRDLIMQAETEASKTCELCGATENMGYTCGWITTCCRECAEKIAKKNVNGLRWYDYNLKKTITLH